MKVYIIKSLFAKGSYFLFYENGEESMHYYPSILQAASAVIGDCVCEIIDVNDPEFDEIISRINHGAAP